MSDYKKTDLNKVIRGSKRATYDKVAIAAILKQNFIAHVSYIYENQAISIPMSYGFNTDEIYLHGSLKNRMLTSILKAEKASITVMQLDGLILARSAFHHSVNYHAATLFCSVSEITTRQEKYNALQNIIEQMIPNRWGSLRPISDKELDSTLVLKLKIETASAKVRDVGVVDNKEDLDFPVWAGVIPIKQVAQDPETDTLLAKNIEVPKHVLDYVEKNK